MSRALRLAYLPLIAAVAACSGRQGAERRATPPSGPESTTPRTDSWPPSLTITDREVLVGPEWTTELASFEWTLVPAAGGPSATERGSYVQVWRHEPDGRWLFARELWNSTAPADTTPKGP